MKKLILTLCIASNLCAMDPTGKSKVPVSPTESGFTQRKFDGAQKYNKKKHFKRALEFDQYMKNARKSWKKSKPNVQ